MNPEIPTQVLLLPDQVKNVETDSRLASGEDARRLLDQLCQEDLARSYQRAIVKGCYDGNQPWNQKRLNQDGQQWRCNLNFQGLEGILDSARIPYYGLFSGVLNYATF